MTTHKDIEILVRKYKSISFITDLEILISNLSCNCQFGFVDRNIIIEFKDKLLDEENENILSYKKILVYFLLDMKLELHNEIKKMEIEKKSSYLVPFFKSTLDNLKQTERLKSAERAFFLNKCPMTIYQLQKIEEDSCEKLKYINFYLMYEYDASCILSSRNELFEKNSISEYWLSEILNSYMIKSNYSTWIALIFAFLKRKFKEESEMLGIIDWDKIDNNPKDNFGQFDLVLEVGKKKYYKEENYNLVIKLVDMVESIISIDQFKFDNYFNLKKDIKKYELNLNFNELLNEIVNFYFSVISSKETDMRIQNFELLRADGFIFKYPAKDNIWKLICIHICNSSEEVIKTDKNYPALVANLTNYEYQNKFIQSRYSTIHTNNFGDLTLLEALKFDLGTLIDIIYSDDLFVIEDLDFMICDRLYYHADFKEIFLSNYKKVVALRDANEVVQKYRKERESIVLPIEYIEGEERYTHQDSLRDALGGQMDAYSNIN